MNPVLIVFQERSSGRVVQKMPLYEFLQELHNYACSDAMPFEDLRVVVDGKELAPSMCGHA
jgi:hypothetical protein